MVICPETFARKPSYSNGELRERPLRNAKKASDVLQFDVVHVTPLPLFKSQTSMFLIFLSGTLLMVLNPFQQ